MTVFERRRLGVGIIAFVVLVLVALLFAIPKIQDSRSAAVARQLRAAGITGIKVDFSGRDGTLIGPAGKRAAALAAVHDRDGIRSLTYRTPAPAHGATPTTAAPTPATTARPGTSTTAPAVRPAAPLDLTTTVNASTVTLAGGVTTATERAALDAAATTGFGAGHVQDQVTVVGGTRPAAGQAAFTQYSTLVDQLGPRLDHGTLNLTSGAMAAAGVAFSKDAATALNQGLAQATAQGVATTGTFQVPAPVDAAGLQTNLTDLLGRSGINFAPASSVIDASSREVLNTAAQAIVAAPPVNIQVNGYTDNTGGAAANLVLSRRRADVVRLYLISQGVAGSRLTAKGFGEDKPIADNSTPEGRRQNRRIELIVTGS